MFTASVIVKQENFFKLWYNHTELNRKIVYIIYRDIVFKTKINYVVNVRNYIEFYIICDLQFFFVNVDNLLKWLKNLDNDHLQTKIVKKNIYLTSSFIIRILIATTEISITCFFIIWWIELFETLNVFVKNSIQNSDYSLSKNILFRIFITFDVFIIENVNYHIVFRLIFVDFFRFEKFTYEKSFLKNSQFNQFHLMKRWIIFHQQHIDILIRFENQFFQIQCDHFDRNHFRCDIFLSFKFTYIILLCLYITHNLIAHHLMSLYSNK